MAGEDRLGDAMSARLLMAAALSSCLMAAQASAQTADTAAEKTKLAGELVAASGGADQLNRTMGVIYTQMRSLFDQTADPKARRIGALVIDRMQAEMTAMAPKMVDVTASIYASDLTEDELRSLLAWQESAVGQSIAKKMPQIARESMMQMMPMIQQAIQNMRADVLDEVCKEQQCTADQREQIARIMDKAMPKGS
jgi:hypothetical protein